MESEQPPSPATLSTEVLNNYSLLSFSSARKYMAQRQSRFIYADLKPLRTVHFLLPLPFKHLTHLPSPYEHYSLQLHLFNSLAQSLPCTWFCSLMSFLILFLITVLNEYGSYLSRHSSEKVSTKHVLVI